MIYIPDVSGGVKGLFNIVPEGLEYVSPAKRYVFKWSKISNIFPWKKPNALTVIDVNGEASTGIVFGDRKHGNSWKKMDYIFQQWGQGLKKSSTYSVFEYPNWVEENEAKSRMYNLFWSIGGGLIIILMCVAALRENNWSISNIKDDWPIIFAFLFGLCGLYSGFTIILNRKKIKWKEILVDEHGVTVIYNNGTNATLDLFRVKKHNLSKHRYKGTIVFQDGTKLINLERASYWPVLREYLLSRLEPLEEDKDK